VYRGLDVGTAKATADERARVRHHCLDLVDPDEPFSVADFVTHAGRALDGIATRGGIALLVGGTGLYLRAVARGLDVEALPFDPVVRATLDEELARDGLALLVARLEAAAPGTAARTDLRNPRRVVRALERATVVGDAPPPPPRGYAGSVAWIGLDVDRETHRRWIADRAATQLEGGILDEARTLRARYPETLLSLSAIGYREAFDLLDGRIGRARYLEVNAGRNAAFARRQRTWFRSEPGITWLDAGADPFAAALEAARGLLGVERVSSSR
jgi:tRNA dimethylallyltransferase